MEMSLSGEAAVPTITPFPGTALSHSVTSKDGEQSRGSFDPLQTAIRDPAGL